MSELYRHDVTLFKNYTGGDIRRVPAGGVTLDVYREGSTVASPVTFGSGSGGTVTVYDPGCLVAGDTVQNNTNSAVTRTVASITGTTVVLNAGSGTLTLVQYDRLVPTNNRPLTWKTDRNDSGFPQTSVASQDTTDGTTGTASFYTAEMTVDLIATDSGTLTLYRDQTGVGGRVEYTPQIYGARGDATVNDAGAFDDLFEYLKARSGVATIPPGTYVLNANLTVNTISGLKIRGAGPSMTNLIINHSGEGFTVKACNDFELSGMTIVRTSGSVADISIDAACTRAVVKDCVFSSGGIGVLDSGTDSTMTNLQFISGSWSRMIHLYKAVRPHLRSIKGRWTGALSAAAIDIDTDVSSARLEFVDVSPVTVGSDNGIALRVSQISAGSNSPYDIQCFGCRFAGGTGAGGKQGVQLATASQVEFYGSLVVDSLIGYEIANVNSVKIIGGSHVNIRQDGVDINSGSNIWIVAHDSSNVNVGAGTNDHVNIAAGVDDVFIHGLRVGRHILGTGTAQARYGVRVESGVSDRVQILGLCGIRSDLTTGWISNLSTSSAVDTSHNIEDGASSVTFGHISMHSAPPALITLSGTQTTASVRNTGRIYLQQSGATVITNFTDAADGQQLLLFAGNGNTTINDGGNFALAGNWTSGINDTLSLVFSATLNVWCETGRSNN